MTSDSFYKGYSKTTGERIAARIYEEPHPDPFSKHNNIAEILIVGDGTRRFIQNYDTLDELYDLQREISQIEFECLEKIGRLSTEIFLNQYTGGFPSPITCVRILNGLARDFNKLIEAQNVGGYFSKLAEDQEVNTDEKEAELYNGTDD